MEDGDAEVQGRLGVGCVKRAELSRVLIDMEGNVQCLLDVARGAFDVQDDAIGRGGGDPEAAGVGEVDDGLIVLLAGAEQLGELLRGQIVAVTGAGRVVEVLQQGGQLGLVAQGQADGQVQALGGGEAVHRLEAQGGSGHMASNDLSFDGHGGEGDRKAAERRQAGAPQGEPLPKATRRRGFRIGWLHNQTVTSWRPGNGIGR